MRDYIVEYHRYFSGRHTITVEADNKREALQKAKDKLSADGEVIENTIKVVKKLQN